MTTFSNERKCLLTISKVSNNRRWIHEIEELQSVKFNIPLVSDIGSVVLKKVCRKLCAVVFFIAFAYTSYLNV